MIYIFKICTLKFGYNAYCYTKLTNSTIRQLSNTLLNVYPTPIQYTYYTSNFLNQNHKHVHIPFSLNIRIHNEFVLCSFSVVRMATIAPPQPPHAPNARRANTVSTDPTMWLRLIAMRALTVYRAIQCATAAMLVSVMIEFALISLS